MAQQHASSRVPHMPPRARAWPPSAQLSHVRAASGLQLAPRPIAGWPTDIQAPAIIATVGAREQSQDGDCSLEADVLPTLQALQVAADATSRAAVLVCHSVELAALVNCLRTQPRVRAILCDPRSSADGVGIPTAARCVDGTLFVDDDDDGRHAPPQLLLIAHEEAAQRGQSCETSAADAASSRGDQGLPQEAAEREVLVALEYPAPRHASTVRLAAVARSSLSSSAPLVLARTQLLNPRCEHAFSLPDHLLAVARANVEQLTGVHHMHDNPLRGSSASTRGNVGYVIYDRRGASLEAYRDAVQRWLENVDASAAPKPAMVLMFTTHAWKRTNPSIYTKAEAAALHAVARAILPPWLPHMVWTWGESPFHSSPAPCQREAAFLAHVAACHAGGVAPRSSLTRSGGARHVVVVNRQRLYRPPQLPAQSVTSNGAPLPTAYVIVPAHASEERWHSITGAWSPFFSLVRVPATYMSPPRGAMLGQLAAMRAALENDSRQDRCAPHCPFIVILHEDARPSPAMTRERWAAVTRLLSSHDGWGAYNGAPTMSVSDEAQTQAHPRLSVIDSDGANGAGDTTTTTLLIATAPISGARMLAIHRRAARAALDVLEAAVMDCHDDGALLRRGLTADRWVQCVFRWPVLVSDPAALAIQAGCPSDAKMDAAARAAAAAAGDSIATTACAAR